MQLPDTIFRSYDIRGIYPNEINEAAALHIGKAYGTFLMRRGVDGVVVGMDDRATSPQLMRSLILGLISTGMNVTNIGVTLTPVIHFLTCAWKFRAGVIVTASHNPKDFNGFRFDLENAEPFFGDRLKELYKSIEKEDYVRGSGSEKIEDLSVYYLDFFKKSFSFKKKLKIVVDCGSGASSVIAPKVFEALGCQVVPVYCRYESNFPRGVPDPENPLFMKELSAAVLQNGADLGVAFDTDGDRMGIVDEKGVAYETDKLLLLFAKDVLKKYPRSLIVYDVKCSGVLDREIKFLGGNPKMIKTGHTGFVEEMKNGAALGCELSGHTYFSGEYFGYDDGIYGACRAIKIITEAEKPLSVLMSIFPKKYHSNEIKLKCADEHKFVIIKDVLERIHKKNAWENFKILDHLEIDGVRVKISETGWFLIRASNTSPYLSVRFEGNDMGEIQILRSSLKEVLEKFSLDLKVIDNAEVHFS